MVGGMSEQYDVIVIGGGAAGLSGALTLARARRRVLVVDGGQPRNAPAAGVHNYLGRENTPPGELLEIGRAEARGYGAEFTDGVVTNALREGDGFRVELAGGTSLAARRLLVTTGLTDELPDIPGLAEGWGRRVLHCPFCHGWEVRDRPVGVIAVGALAAHQALLWTQWTDDVVLFTNNHEMPDISPKVRVVEGEVVGVDDVGVHLRDGTVVAREAVVVQTRMAARAGFLDGLGLETADLEMQGEVVATYVPADPMGKTAVEGVWVAGNVADPMAQVIVAAGAGLKAAAAIIMDLLE
ncbi:NAD(P)/FAD-dependent oxidoreductase [Dactylosporangium sp. NPDC048998]|uniref:NAD(P)/FAD-dependent oxidoreductase n=1 Tax=Dactylosporangium sp. NPDC048998 TaxID=3363976 RepID=UPI003722D468